MPATTTVLALIVALQGAFAGPVRVDVDGVSSELRRNIRAHLSLVRRQGEGDLEESTVQALHQRAPEEIRQALRPFGYYRPEIEGELLERGPGWLARYRVDPGAVVHYARVEVDLSGEGADDPALQGILPRMGVEEGAVLLHERWEQAKQTLLNQAAGRGYLDVQITRARVEVDTTALTARAALAVRTGPRYRFGEVRLPSTPFVGWFMDRYVTFRPGDYFDLDALLAMQRGLSSSDYFRFAQVEPRRSEADSLRVPIAVSLELQTRTSYTVGAGYGTDTGVRGTAAWRRRWLNPYGHRMQAEVRASLRTQSFAGRYIIPLGSGPSDRVALSSVAEREAFEAVESREVFARVELDHALGAWRQVIGARLAESWSRDETGESTTTLLIPEIGWTRVWGDDVLYPRAGYRVELDLSGATRRLISDVGFVQARLQLGAARGLHRTGRVLVRLEGGITRTDDLPALPVSLRFFAGGDQSVRGFGYQSIGPVGEEGTVIGGRHLIVGSVELEQMVYGPFGVAAFTDAGNAFRSRTGISLNDMEQGAGVGVRWRSPIGLVRADVAWPVSRPDRGPRLHFVVGGVL